MKEPKFYISAEGRLSQTAKILAKGVLRLIAAGGKKGIKNK